MEQVAEQACLEFRQTFNDPGSILKAFRSNIRKKIRYLNPGDYSAEELELLYEHFAARVFVNMYLISADVIRERLSKEIDLKNFKPEGDLPSKDKAKRFEHFCLQIMEILINVIYKHQKGSKNI